MSFHVGQKVVCVDGAFAGSWLDASSWCGHGNQVPILPVEGHIYTVRGIRLYPFIEGEDQALYLAEIHNPVGRFDDGRYEQPFWVGRFRPVQTRSTETGMSILRKVADDASKRQNLIISVD